ncbi:hypothetical protein D3C71_1980350 [compost metagenome]
MGLHPIPQVEAPAAIGRGPQALIGLAKQFERVLGGLAYELLGRYLDVIRLGGRGSAGAERQNRQREASELE